MTVDSIKCSVTVDSIKCSGWNSSHILDIVQLEKVLPWGNCKNNQKYPTVWSNEFKKKL